MPGIPFRGAAAAHGVRAWKVLATTLLMIAAGQSAAQHYRFEPIAGGGVQGPYDFNAGYTDLGDVATDAAGNQYVTEYGANRIRRIDVRTGVVSIIAGNGESGFSGDGGPATSARLSGPNYLAIDAEGRVVFTDALNNRVRRIELDGTITSIAGNGATGNDGDGGPARDATLDWPSGLAVAANGDIYVSNTHAATVRRIDAAGIITTVAGTGTPGYGGDGGPGPLSQLDTPGDIAFDRTGGLLIVDSKNDRIRRLAPDGTIDTFAGTGNPGAGPSGVPARYSDIFLPTALAVARDGSVLFYDENCLLRQVVDGYVNAIAGDWTCTPHGDGSYVGNAGFGYVVGIAIDPANNVYMADSTYSQVRRIDGSSWIITTASGIGTYAGDGGPATESLLSASWDIAVDASGNVAIADIYYNDRIRRISSDGWMSTLVGGLGATQIAFDAVGNLYIVRHDDCKVDIVHPDGTWKHVAGHSSTPNVCPSSGDGGPALAAELRPDDVAVDASGNLYIADSVHARVRKVGLDGIIRTIAGNGSPGFDGDGGRATNARLNQPRRIAIGKDGSLYIADYGNHRIRKVTPDGIIRTVAGGGTDAGDRVASALDAKIGNLSGIAVDRDGTVFLAEGSRLRALSPGGVLSTIRQWHGNVADVTVDKDGTLYVISGVGRAFRGRIVRDGTIAHDVEDDGKDDLLWRNRTSGQMVLWRGAEATLPQAVASIKPLDWDVAAFSDFDGDSSADLLLRSGASGENMLWSAADSHSRIPIASLPGGGWKATAADFDDDGHADLVWSDASGRTLLWPDADASRQRTLAASMETGWMIAGAGDLRGDGRPDLVWHNDASGASIVWEDGEPAHARALDTIRQPGWRVAGIGDFDGDGRDDLYFYNAGNGWTAVWAAGEHSGLWTNEPVGDLAWTPTAFGDYDGDGRDDVLWHDAATGDNVIWSSGNRATRRDVAAVPDVAWQAH